MARRVYFAFHYQADIFRVNVVRNHDVTKEGIDQAGFYDGSLWEKAQKTDPASLKRLINGGLENSSVTCVLVGGETASRPWVKYELEQSVARGNGLLAIKINWVKGVDGQYGVAGPNPLDSLVVQSAGRAVWASSVYATRDWILEDGYKNFGTWVEDAAKKAGR